MALVSVVCTVNGPVFERYWAQLEPGLRRFFLPGVTEIVKLDGERGWPWASSERYRFLLESLDRISGDWIFQIDADMLCLDPIGADILAAGIVTTEHPGMVGKSPSEFPYERREWSKAYVAPGEEGSTYHPGCFVGGRRAEFLEMAGWIADRVSEDKANGVQAVWYEESYLNRWFIDHPPALVLPGELYCGWQHQGYGPQTRLVHLDKTPEEFAETRGT